MPKVDIAALPEQERSGYLKPYDEALRGRHWRALAGDLADFGVNLVTLEPGSASSQRHWHTAEDELVYMLSGEAVLIEDEGETLLRAGDAAAFPKGVPNGHCLINRGETPCRFLAIGTDRPDVDQCYYPDIDQFWSTATGYVRKADGP